MATQSLFDKYGGFSGVSRIVMSFYDAVLDSERIGDFFEHVDMPRLIDHQTKFMAALLGGPADIGDKRLAQVHLPLGIGAPEFEEMKTLLAGALRDNGVAEEDVRSVVDAIEARRALIVAS